MEQICLPSGKLVTELKVDRLRKELSQRRLSKLGKKQELVDRLAEFLLTERLAKKEEDSEDGNVDAEQLDITDDGAAQGAAQVKMAVTPTNIGTPNVNFRTHSHRRSSRTTTDVINLSRNSLLSEDEVNASPKSALKERKSAQEMEEAMDVDGNNSADVQKVHPEEPDENANTEETQASTSTKSNIPVPANSRSKSKGRVEGRFKEAHSKLIDNAETLGEAQDKVLKRHRELLGKVPDVVKRLATPKAVAKRQPLSKENPSTPGLTTPKSVAKRQALSKKNPSTPGPSVKFDPNLDLNKKDAFQFGDVPVNDFAKIVGTCKDEESTTSQQKKNSASKDRKKEHQLGAKEMAKKRVRAGPNPLTQPLENTFINFMSTPKGKKAEKEPKRKGYTPYKGAVKFLDTTKLTAQEYALAVEEGLIPATTKKSASKSQTGAEIAKMNRKQRTDQILSIKRKLAV